MTEQPRAILFDLDDTIINAYTRPDLAWLAVIAEFADALAPVAPAEAAAAINAFARQFWGEPEQHRLHRQNLQAARREIVAGAFAGLIAGGKAAPEPEVAIRLADRFTAFRDEQMHLFDDAHATLDELRRRDVRLALVTNGDGAAQRAKVERFELAHRFDHIQIEGEHGFGKPEERAYRHALDALQVGAHETWIVGDNLEWEVAAPQRLGIHAIWYDPLGGGLPDGVDILPDRIIRRLAELLESS